MLESFLDLLKADDKSTLNNTEGFFHCDQWLRLHKPTFSLVEHRPGGSLGSKAWKEVSELFCWWQRDTKWPKAGERWQTGSGQMWKCSKVMQNTTVRPASKSFYPSCEEKINWSKTCVCTLRNRKQLKSGHRSAASLILTRYSMFGDVNSSRVLADRLIPLTAWLTSLCTASSLLGSGRRRGGI